jgi:DNA invertase Pin-like site-specific DNA recombinase
MGAYRAAIRAALYLRSFPDEVLAPTAEPSAAQEDALRKLAARRGWEVAAVYEDACACASGPRPGFRQLRKAIKRGDVDVVLAWRLDRLAKDQPAAVAFLLLCEQHEVDLATDRDGIDTTTPIGKAAFKLCHALDKMADNLARERVRVGMVRVRRQGRRIGRPRVPVTPDEAAAAVKQHGSIRSAAEALGCSPSLIVLRQREARVRTQLLRDVAMIERDLRASAEGAGAQAGAGTPGGAQAGRGSK